MGTFCYEKLHKCPYNICCWHFQRSYPLIMKCIVFNYSSNDDCFFPEFWRGVRNFSKLHSLKFKIKHLAILLMKCLFFKNYIKPLLQKVIPLEPCEGSIHRLWCFIRFLLSLLWVILKTLFWDSTSTHWHSKLKRIHAMAKKL